MCGIQVTYKKSTNLYLDDYLLKDVCLTSRPLSIERRVDKERVHIN